MYNKYRVVDRETREYVQKHYVLVPEKHPEDLAGLIGLADALLASRRNPALESGLREWIG